jgi:hypothetical protein
VTIDAMACHPHIAEQIHGAGGDYVIGRDVLGPLNILAEK